MDDLPSPVAALVEAACGLEGLALPTFGVGVGFFALSAVLLAAASDPVTRVVLVLDLVLLGVLVTLSGAILFLCPDRGDGGGEDDAGEG